MNEFPPYTINLITKAVLQSNKLVKSKMILSMPSKLAIYVVRYYNMRHRINIFMAIIKEIR